jgi:uncharacterized membrane protein YeaQ/YmgE (transglycosylase-associated protein family)
MTLGQITVAALVGLMAAFLASRLVTEHGYGVVGDIVVGVSGAMIGAVVLGAFITHGVLAPLGIAGGSPVAQIIVPLIGAVIPLAVLRVVRTVAWAGLGVRAADGDTASHRGQGTSASAPGTGAAVARDRAMAARTSGMDIVAPQTRSSEAQR